MRLDEVDPMTRMRWECELSALIAQYDHDAMWSSLQNRRLYYSAKEIGSGFEWDDYVFDRFDVASQSDDPPSR